MAKGAPKKTIHFRQATINHTQDQVRAAALWFGVFFGVLSRLGWRL